MHVHSACCALVQPEPGTLQRGRSGLRVWCSPSGRWPPLGAAERSLRAGSHMWDSPARPGGGAEKESWFLARTRSYLDSCLRRSTMAARQRLPSSSDSHAPEDYPDSLQVPAFWEILVGNWWKANGLDFAKFRSAGDLECESSSTKTGLATGPSASGVTIGHSTQWPSVFRSCQDRPSPLALMEVVEVSETSVERRLSLCTPNVYLSYICTVPHTVPGPTPNHKVIV